MLLIEVTRWNWFTRSFDQWVTGSSPARLTTICKKTQPPEGGCVCFLHTAMLRILRRYLAVHCFVATGAGFCTVFGSTVISCRRFATSGVIDS